MKKTIKLSQCTALMVWGTNLPSTVGIKYTLVQLAMVKLPLYIQRIIVGLILSDGGLSFAGVRSKNALFILILEFTQSAAHSGYFWSVFNLLSHYCSSFPIIRNRIRYGVPSIGLQFATRSMPCLTELHSLFYVNKVKIIPVSIYDLLTPVALSHCIAGDGTHNGNGLIICIDSYSVPDIVRLMNVLMIRYRLECSLHYCRGYPRIYIWKGSIPTIRGIVEPLLHPSMRYKLGK